MVVKVLCKMFKKTLTERKNIMAYFMSDMLFFHRSTTIRLHKRRVSNHVALIIDQETPTNTQDSIKAWFNTERIYSVVHRLEC